MLPKVHLGWLLSFCCEGPLATHSSVTPHSTVTHRGFSAGMREECLQTPKQECLLLIGFLQTMTGFLIYDWIEQPKKQEIIKEVLSLLEQKVLEPHSGEYRLCLTVELGDATTSVPTLCKCYVLP